MGSPYVEQIVTSSETSDTTSHTISLGLVEDGDFLLAAMVADGTPGFTWPGGWTLVDRASSTNNRLEVYYKVASSEGASISVTTGSSKESASILLRIRNTPASITIDVENDQDSTGTDANPDPAVVIPTGAPQDVMVLAFAGADTGDLTFSAFPAGYTNTTQVASGGSTGVVAGLALTTLGAASSEDPAAFTLDSAAMWSTLTVALRGGITGAQGIGTRYGLAGMGHPNAGLVQRHGLVAMGYPGNRDGALSPTIDDFTSDLDGTNSGAGGVDWNESDRLHVHLIPSPGLNANSRLAMAGIPGTADSGADNDGDITVTIDTYTAAFAGTYTEPQAYDGLIAATLDDFTASFVGGAVFSLFFEVDYQVLPAWNFIFQPQRDGDLTVTLDEYTASAIGQALPPDSTGGLIAATADDCTAAFTGTFVAPQNFDGLINASIENFTTLLTGTAVPSSSNIGAIAANLEDFSGVLSGTHVAPVFDGALVQTWGDFTTLFQGQFIDANAINGRINANVTNFTMAASGTSNVPGSLDDVVARCITEGDDDVRCVVDGTGAARWRKR